MEQEQQKKPLPMPPPASPPLKSGPENQYHDMLNHFIDDIEERILLGESFRAISKAYNVNLTTFYRWRRDTKHNARIVEAMEFSSEQLVEKAEEILLEKQEDGNMAEIQRKKALSAFYQWKAGRKAPRVFGDTKDVNVTVKNDRLMNDDQFDTFMKGVLSTAGKQIESGDNKTEDIPFEDIADNSLDTTTEDGNDV